MLRRCFKVIRKIFILFFTQRGNWRKKVKILARAIFEGGRKTRQVLDELVRDKMYSSTQLQKLIQLVTGLHLLMHNKNPKFFSILIPVYHPKIDFFKVALEAAFAQTAPKLEVLIGFDGADHGPEYMEAVLDLQKKATNRGLVVKTFVFARNEFAGGISSTLNALAERASGDYLLLFDHDDWIRPDLLYRYHQTLLTLPANEKSVLYCNEYKIDERGNTVEYSEFFKPFAPEFPFVFVNWICHCLLVPKTMWSGIGGLLPEFDGAQDFDLCLRLDEMGARFHNVPFFLYAWRVHSQSTAGNANQKGYAHEAGISALNASFQRRGIDWEVCGGLYPTSYRAVPRNQTVPSVHVIIPYRDQGDITLKCVEALLRQQKVNLFITAIDNNSSDKTIQEQLQKQSVEVLDMAVPFNFSYLNNQGLAQSQCPAHFDLVLFLNNDVVMEADALAEMAHWLSFKKVGAAGNLLVYPDGKVQHGGVAFDKNSKHQSMGWLHIGHGSKDLDRGFHSVINTPDAVTGASLMMRKSVFNEVGGFDEVQYPVAFSDTNLCMKIRQLGYTILYTPYAKGVHHESQSRGKDHIEDYEGSTWLHAKYFANQKSAGKPVEPIFYPMLWM